MRQSPRFAIPRASCGAPPLVWTACLLATVALSATACSRGRKSERWFVHHSQNEWVDRALDHPEADERRIAVTHIADTSPGEPWARELFDTVARTDPDAMVRVAAIDGIGRAADASDVATLTKLLRTSTAALEDTRLSPGQVRWEATRVVGVLIAQDKINAEDREPVLALLLDRVENDASRHVRQAALESLRWFPDPRVIPPLLTALDDRDFTTRHTAATGLEHLTGESLGRDAYAWRVWLAEHRDPFAKNHHSADSTTESSVMANEVDSEPANSP